MANHDHRPELVNKLIAGEFRDRVALHFEDGGFVMFEYALAVREGGTDGNHPFVVVYTEHCGYHVFYTNSIVWDGMRNGPIRTLDASDRKRLGLEQ